MSNEKFILLNHWNGRFGNRMHQYAYGVTYSKLNNVPFILPSDWEGTRLFKHQHHTVLTNDDVRLHINQTSKELSTIEYRERAMQKHYPTIKRIHPEIANQNYIPYDHPVYFDSVCVYSSAIFVPMEKNHLLNVFEFSDEVKSTEAYKFWSARKGTYNIAHLRRDDIASPEYNKNNPQGYSVISVNSYQKAFAKFGIDEKEIIWISDDRTGKWHTMTTPMPNFGWSYPIGSNHLNFFVFDWLEDFLKLYFAKTIFRANSSFSWWASFLSPTATVYSPVLDKQLIYGIDGLEEIDVEFVEGNHPHWMYNNDDIIIN
jgi:hypothetical protein